MVCCAIVNGRRCDGDGGGGAVEGAALQLTGMANPPTASTDTSVIEWANAADNRGSIPIADWATLATDGVNGTRITVTQAGLYDVHLLLVLVGAADFYCAVSLDATAAQLVATNTPLAGDVQYQNRVDFAQPTGIRLMHAFGNLEVTAADITGGTNVVRTHAVNTGDPGGRPVAGIFNLTNSSFKMRKIANVAA